MSVLDWLLDYGRTVLLGLMILFGLNSIQRVSSEVKTPLLNIQNGYFCIAGEFPQNAVMKGNNKGWEIDFSPPPTDQLRDLVP